MSKKNQPSAAQQVILIPVDDVVPYDKNPRLNEPAVEAVLASILQFGFRVPIIVDADNVIVTGHTRVLAVQRLRERDPEGFAQLFEAGVPAFRATDLTEEQLRAFRLIDNKTSELASWDFDLLAGEVALLAETGIQLTEFGWTAEEVDCLKSVVSDDCLDPSNWKAPEVKADGVDTAFLKPKALGEGADGASVRVVVGTIGFMVLRTDYDAWFEGLMKDNNYDFDLTTEEVARRMGLLDAKNARDEARRRAQATMDAENNATGQTAPAVEQPTEVVAV